MENLTGGTPPVRYLLCVVPCKLYFWIHEITTQVPYVIIGTVFLGVGIVGGLGLSFYAMIKYNKGIF